MKKLKLTKLFLASSLSVLLYNCEGNSENISELNSVEAPQSAHVCVEKWGATDKQSKAASIKSKEWENGKTIRVKFLNGNSYVQSKVKQYAVEWESHANIKISFKEGQYANNGGSWSYLRTDSNSHPESMHFGWFNNSTSEASFKKTTIHEFGHALGLIHEHQNPVAGIKWDKEAVYNYYAGPPNNWTRAKVDSNLFSRYEASVSNFSTYDPLSIMHYPVPAEHTTNGVAVGSNSKLSTTDKSFIARIYPSTGNPPTSDICDGAIAYNGNSFYSTGDKVTYNGNLYQRTSSGRWTNLGKCDN